MRFDLRALADAMDKDQYPGGDILREAAGEIERQRVEIIVLAESMAGGNRGWNDERTPVANQLIAAWWEE